jgi:hypothetical protein
MSMIDEIRNLDKVLKKQLVSSRILLDRLRVIDESSRKSGAYQDPFYFPFYYYLGKILSPKSMTNIGLRLALNTCCFLKSCKTIENIYAFERRTNEFFSPRLGLANIKDVNKKINVNFFYGSIVDFANFKNRTDLILYNEQINQDKFQESLEIMWENLNFDGFYVVDYIDSNKNINNAFFSFCKIANRDPILFKTRYGIGIVQK